MNIKELADLLGTASNTIRRWCAEYYKFLSPSAHPPKGQTRILEPQDVQILHYIAASRDIGRPFETIMAHLEAMQADNWQDLPPVPEEWQQPTQNISTAVAAKVGYDVAHVAVLQRDLEHAQTALLEAENRLGQLEQDNAALQASQTATEAEKHTLQIDLEKARGEVSTLQARLSSYAITGGEKPIPVALIIVTALAAGAILVIVSMVVARLLL